MTSGHRVLLLLAVLAVAHPPCGLMTLLTRLILVLPVDAVILIEWRDDRLDRNGAWLRARGRCRGGGPFAVQDALMAGNLRGGAFPAGGRWRSVAFRPEFASRRRWCRAGRPGRSAVDMLPRRIFV